MRNSSSDRLQDTLPICHHVVIVETKDAISLRRKERIAARIALDLLGFKMLSAIDLDNEIGIMTDEIDNIRPNRRLAPKACAARARAYGIPDRPLCVS
jgi:hypothetical protein